MKSSFQTMIFSIIFVTMNGLTHKLFKNILNDDVQNEIKGEINMTKHNHSKNGIYPVKFIQGRKYKI